eukprot:tig00000178_g12728.t1
MGLPSGFSSTPSDDVIIGGKVYVVPEPEPDPEEEERAEELREARAREERRREISEGQRGRDDHDGEDSWTTEDGARVQRGESRVVRRDVRTVSVETIDDPEESVGPWIPDWEPSSENAPEYEVGDPIPLRGHWEMEYRDVYLPRSIITADGAEIPVDENIMKLLDWDKTTGTFKNQNVDLSAIREAAGLPPLIDESVLEMNPMAALATANTTGFTSFVEDPSLRGGGGGGGGGGGAQEEGGGGGGGGQEGSAAEEDGGAYGPQLEPAASYPSEGAYVEPEVSHDLDELHIEGGLAAETGADAALDVWS